MQPVTEHRFASTRMRAARWNAGRCQRLPIERSGFDEIFGVGLVEQPARHRAAGNFSPRDARCDSAFAAHSVQAGRGAAAHRRKDRSAHASNVRRREDQPFRHALGGTNAATASSALRCLVASARLMRFCTRRYSVHPHTHEKPRSVARSPVSLQ